MINAQLTPPPHLVLVVFLPLLLILLLLLLLLLVLLLRTQQLVLIVDLVTHVLGPACVTLTHACALHLLCVALAIAACNAMMSTAALRLRS